MSKSLLGNVVRAIAAGVATLAVFGAVSCMTAKARSDRDWYPYLKPTSHVTYNMEIAGRLAEARAKGDKQFEEILPQSFEVKPVSDWTYDDKGPVEKNYDSQFHRIDDLKNVWFVLEPQPGMDYAAHTFLLFEFTNDRMIGITIEARREADEEYSAVAGAFNQYELSYLWAEARDLLTRRAVMLQHETFVYPLTLDDKTKDDLLRNLLRRTDDLEGTPRFYNTLFSNCTNELAKATKLKWDPSFIFTGKSDQHLFKLKIIPGTSFEAARKRADLTQFVRDQNGKWSAAGFDAALLKELRAREAQ